MNGLWVLLENEGTGLLVPEELLDCRGAVGANWPLEVALSSRMAEHIRTTFLLSG
jgi:hypothetical protein